MENFFSNRKLSYSALGAVVFDAESFDADGSGVRRDASHIQYKIRLRAEQYLGTYQPQSGVVGKWYTERMYPVLRIVGPRGDEVGGRVPGCNERYLVRP